MICRTIGMDTVRKKSNRENRMGNITETGHFEELQEESDKDKCNLCNNDSPYDKSEPVDDRIAYIEGSGQMCLNCYDKVYGHEWNRDREQKIRDAEHYSKNGKIINVNINKLQKKYDDAVKNNIDVFMYDGAEILTSYAKYLLEYLKIEQNNE